MRDKLADGIAAARHPHIAKHLRPPPLREDYAIADATLAWLREYLGSDEVVNSASDAVAVVLDGFENDPSIIARAALSSIMEQSDGR